MMFRTLRSCLIFVLTSSVTTAIAEAPAQPGNAASELILKVERELEEWRHDLLNKTINKTAAKIKPFSTDGCSGGLSDGWHYMSRIIPAFKNNFGDKPPWEACCVTHDRAYWAGDTDAGFERRLQADEELRQCVIEFGKKNSEAFSRQFSLNRTLIEKQFTITAELMYRAVRVGGQPCTLFPWRWGYGWPYCNNDTEKDKL